MYIVLFLYIKNLNKKIKKKKNVVETNGRNYGR